MNHIKQALVSVAIVALTIPAQAQDTTLKIHVNKGENIISKEIYGQFAEHLGSCIYGGLWVGKDSKIPNYQGYRADVFNALKELRVPVLRWPGGCFADEYHWMDGIGPQSKRPKLANNNWGGTIEDNSFGTNEFLNLCELLGCEPYISGNVGSGTVEELADWVQYMTSDGDTPMARLRRENGRDKPWKVKFLGIGNESWGCGGNMRPEYYSDVYRRYALYCRNYDGNQLYKIASGASDYDYNWTNVLMNNVGQLMNGLSLHYYTVSGWDGSKGSATQFSDDDYYWTIGKCLEIDSIIKRHSAIMDKTDPQKKIGLMVDEWGTWWDEEPGTVHGHLYQQNSLRDAFVAALTLNVFQSHADRVRMTNIAQVVNVLQSMILTDTIGQGRMVLTPTYHVFNMYKEFQDATALPVDVKCDSMRVRNNRVVPLMSVSAARQANGAVYVSLANISLDKAQEVELSFDGTGVVNAEGQVLTAKSVEAYNDFNHPNDVKPTPFTDFKLNKHTAKANIPAKSIVVIRFSTTTGDQ